MPCIALFRWLYLVSIFIFDAETLPYKRHFLPHMVMAYLFLHVLFILNGNPILNSTIHLAFNVSICLHSTVLLFKEVHNFETWITKM